jgi:predicted AAA+ superfamily ATPase
VNCTNVANDAQVARTTVYEYFEILKDTLVLYEVPAWRKTKTRKRLASSKYYFFDVGVLGALQGRAFRPGTPAFGEGFETFLMYELVSHRDYVSGETLSYWRSTSGFEVFHPRGSYGCGSQGQGKRVAAGSEILAGARRGNKDEALSLRVSGAAPARDR